MNAVGTRKILCYAAMLLLLCFVVNAQTRRGFRFVGTVIDDSGDPVVGANVTMIPTGGWLNPQPHVVTKSDGSFELFYDGLSRPTNWTIYTADGSLGFSPISELFDVLPKYSSAFGGLPFVVTSESEVANVGAIPVQYWYEKVTIPIRIEGRHLKKEEWEYLWCGVLIQDGRMVAESTIPLDPDTVDLENSTLTLSLPEGDWKVQFNKFVSPVHLSEDVIGATDTFNVARGNPRTLAPVNIKLKGVKMKRM